MNSYIDCNNIDAKECLSALVNEVNDELTVACQIPFTVPKKEITRIVNRAKKYFYKMYEDSLEEMYIALPAKTWKEGSFNSGIKNDTTNITNDNLTTNRGVVNMPDSVFSVNGVYEINGFAGEAGGYGSSSLSGDPDLSVNKFIYNNSYGIGAGSENLMYYIINEKFMDNTRQALQPHISYSYNRLTHRLRFMGELPENDVIFQIYSKIPDCSLFQDEIFIEYVTAKTKTQLARILGTFNYNLPGNITINFDLISSEGREELSSVIETLKSEDSADYFFTS